MKKEKHYLILATTIAISIALSTGVAGAKCLDARTPDPSEFSSPQSNLYFPMAIGTTYVYWAETEDELIRNEITITAGIKVILGVNCTIIHDVEWISPDDGITWFITEETDDWHAWDNLGNFWYFGEWTTEYEYDDDWNPIGSNNDGSWEAGVDGALPGIVLPADPMPGMCYQQEYYEDEAEDMGKVKKLNASISIDYGNYDDCLKTKEWTPLEPGAVEHKYYAPGVGLVFIEELKEKTVEVELINVY